MHCSRVSSENNKTTAAVSRGSSQRWNSADGNEDAALTQQDLQGVGVQVQGLRLLLHHVHLLRLLIVVAVDAGVGQHLQTESRAQ